MLSTRCIPETGRELYIIHVNKKRLKTLTIEYVTKIIELLHELNKRNIKYETLEDAEWFNVYIMSETDVETIVSTIEDVFHDFIKDVETVDNKIHFIPIITVTVL